MFEFEIELTDWGNLNFDKLFPHFSAAKKLYAKSYFKRAISILP